MGDKSAIEWTDATWNPVRGCSIVSKGCTNCYAMRQAHRHNHTGGAYEGLTMLTKGGPVWNGATLQLGGETLIQPVLWRRPRRIFVNSMSDLFHESLDFSYIDKVFAVMARAHEHIFQVLTKRPRRMLEYVGAKERQLSVFRAGHHVELCARWAPPPWPLPNVWLGVSVEDQAAADERIPLLLETPAAVRWISAEPLLGPIVLRDPPNDIGEPRFSYLTRVDGEGPRIDWVVVGGESGSSARPMHPDWARSLRDQCATAGVPFFFKQWGAWSPFTYVSAHDRHKLVRIGHSKHEQRREIAIGGPADGTEAFNMRRAGKKQSGRQLDGRTHDEYPA